MTKRPLLTDRRSLLAMGALGAGGLLLPRRVRAQVAATPAYVSDAAFRGAAPTTRFAGRAVFVPPASAPLPAGWSLLYDSLAYPGGDAVPDYNDPVVNGHHAFYSVSGAVGVPGTTTRFADSRDVAGGGVSAISAGANGATNLTISNQAGVWQGAALSIDSQNPNSLDGVQAPPAGWMFEILLNAPPPPAGIIPWFASWATNLKGVRSSFAGVQGQIECDFLETGLSPLPGQPTSAATLLPCTIHEYAPTVSATNGTVLPRPGLTQTQRQALMLAMQYPTFNLFDGQDHRVLGVMSAQWCALFIDGVEIARRPRVDGLGVTWTPKIDYKVYANPTAANTATHTLALKQVRLLKTPDVTCGIG